MRWAWALTVALGGVDLVWAHAIGLAFTGWAQPAYMLIVLVGIGFIYGYTGRDQRLSDAGHFAALWVGFSLAGVVFTYLAASIAMPLRDAQFVAIGGALGFHWLSWYRVVLSHRWIHWPLAAAYASFLPQIIGSIIYFAHTRQTWRNIELIWLAMISLIVTSVISGLLPALGPYVHFTGGETIYMIVMTTLRAAGPHTFALHDLTGIIKLPSFHAVLLVVFVYVHRPPSRSFVTVAILNAVMLVAIPSEGHHYLVDMIAGAAVAAVCILAFRMVTRELAREEPSSVQRRAAV